MGNSKLNAEWFWVDRWTGSTAFLLPMEARGLYREMLSQAWRRGGALPNNHEMICRAIGATPAEWKRSWPIVERYWREDGDLLVNDTQLEVLGECIALKERRSAAGKAGNAKRWPGDSHSGSQTDRKPIADGVPGAVAGTSPPDPDPDPTPTLDLTPTPTQKTTTPSASLPGPVDSVESTALRRKRDSFAAEAEEVFRYWVLRTERTGKVVFSPRREAKVLARLAEGRTVAELKLAIDGCQSSPFHQGQNETGTVHNDLELICRSAEKVEQFTRHATGKGRNPAAQMAHLFPKQAAQEAMFQAAETPVAGPDSTELFSPPENDDDAF